MTTIEDKRKELEKYGLDKTFMLGVSLAQKEFLDFLIDIKKWTPKIKNKKIFEKIEELKKAVKEHE